MLLWHAMILSSYSFLLANTLLLYHCPAANIDALCFTCAMPIFVCNFAEIDQMTGAISSCFRHPAFSPDGKRQLQDVWHLISSLARSRRNSFCYSSLVMQWVPTELPKRNGYIWFGYCCSMLSTVHRASCWIQKGH